MSTIRGTLERSDLEGGVWVFKTDSGEQYHLADLDPGLERDGSRLELQGRVDNNAMGIGMMGATFVVAQAKAI